MSADQDRDEDRLPFIEGLFHAARALSPDARAEFIARACGDDEPLRREVEELVFADSASIGIQMAQVVEEVLDGAPIPGSALPPGTRVGPYRILEALGEGGMGEVYLAQQEEPIRRRVALKLIKLGMDTRAVVARFESERQALALMSHPNVAKVLDAGSTESGRPYFAMEYVPGLPITEYCDQNRLSVKERLALFTAVCEGVQHAHQKGIVHRDIKPSNVLVQIEENRPVPRIIDFGVAKASDQRLSEKTVYTQLGMVIGTPAYMSPEQAEPSGIDIDTRTDVYSLGVLLYELLVGALPLDPKQLAEAGLDEIRRRIQEDEPSKPSTRVSALHTEGTDFASRRQTDFRTLIRALKGDLDWITLRALEKDRTRRYQTVNALATDIRRHLDNEPVSAGPPGTAYRMAKFARRHRALLGGAAIVTIALVVGLTVALVDLFQVRRQSELAGREAAKARAINEFLVTDLLAEAAPERNPVASEVTVRELLDRAAAKLDGAFPDQPLVGAAVRSTVADTYLTLGSYSEAEQHFRRALDTMRTTVGEQHIDTLRGWASLAMALEAQGRADEAETIYRQLIVDMSEAEDVDPAFRFTVANNLAESRMAQGDYAQAEELHEANLEARRAALGEGHGDTLETMNNLAAIYYLQDRDVESEALFVETWEGRRELLGPEHPLTLISMSNLAVVRTRMGKMAEAEPLLRLALEADRRVQGPEHPDTLTDMHNLARLLDRLDKKIEAEELFHRTLELRRRILPAGHRHTVSTLESLGMLLLDLDRAAEAEPLLREALESRRSGLSSGSRNRVRAGLFLGECLVTLERLDEAEQVLQVSWAEAETSDGISAELRRSLAQLLTRLYEARGDEESAARWRGRGEAGPPRGVQ